MGKSATTAMTYEKTPLNVKLKRAPLQSKRLYRDTNDIELMPTHEVMRRLYKRHSVGMWQTVVIITWAAIIWAKIR